ncbi:molybdopterin-guanine dinucleotide biosynthesis protein B [Myxococcus llanfairpwllgwyngyllgogerychwyrndrobwllllantysiliogogogochensis]|uniref:Sulfur carrier protein FdhD n=1 Tax=Myxococcus llanfairpwllgwyngyllgogerychwyrndrobwllllantysiliogogogochensis TaxID=2590453 RepID=A0A540WPV7_9BACT|nr:molybdopterin-guanine dinucleotide biosynthesis protein B [Myxococcus llanfairpwllgwyngyllgogerychwyrndrobwllllantysiliogogogochensis]TQF11053.1 molybdopterin-guanine dinucleotide biosynthesis protein B [Myxococcus llanfairpwllgwyngyllgogerychwyrndrobwllllantysiliogogogochensis]
MSRVPALSIVGWSGAGKTTLLTRLLPELASRGLRVAAVKHSSDTHPLHRGGSDTARFQEAGACLTGFATPSGVQLTTGTAPTEALPELLIRLAGTLDLALVEGWKDGPLPKLEVWREGLGPPLASSRPEVFALVTDALVSSPSAARLLSPVDTRAIADALLEHLRPPRRAPLPPQDARGVASRPVRRWNGATLLPAEDDTIAVEEPLELRVNGEALATTMRTPGHDRELAVGFLLAEGLIRSADDLGTLSHCGRPGEEGWGNVLEVTPAPGVVIDPDPLKATRRGTLTTSACGVCGRRSVEDLLSRCTPLPPGPRLSPEVVARATERLRDVQRNFARTGGVHAAAALDAEGQLLASFEDVGRHNAVDKVVGALVLARASRAVPAPPVALTRQPVLLAVSGRVSFEIVQKAVMARIPVIAGVSAASTLAIDLALRSHVTLATFVRNGRFNVHTHPERLESAQPRETPGP